MEKAMRRGSNTDSTQDQSSMLFESFGDISEELDAFPPSVDSIATLVDVYFRLLGDSFFNFLHEGLFTSRMRQNTLPQSLLYAVCATSARLPR